MRDGAIVAVASNALVILSLKQQRLMSNVANASKRGQRLLADYAEREHFRADAVWSNVAGSHLRARKHILSSPKLGEVSRSDGGVCKSSAVNRCEPENI